MEFNLFGAEDVRAMQRGGQQAWDDTGANIKGMRDQFTNARAGRAYASGDRQGAARMLAQGGNLDGARVLQGDLRTEQRQGMQDTQAAEALIYQRGRQAKTDQDAVVKQNLDILKQLYEGVRQIPWQSEDSPNPGAKRFAFIQRTLPTLQQFNIDVAPFSKLTPEQLDDERVDFFGGKVEDEIIKFAGGYDVVDPRTKAVRRSVRYGPKPPAGMEYDEDGNLRNIPGYVASKKEVAGATRAPRRAGASSGMNGMSTADLIAALRGGR